MSEDFKLNAVARNDAGKGASRRLRRNAGMIPAIVYGSNKNPQSISISQNELFKHLENEAFYSHIIGLSVEGKEESVILKDLQRHPAKPLILHADFLRVSKTKKFSTRVPLHFINETTCVGVKVQGGVISRTMTELEISCLPANLPEFIEVDVENVEIGHIVHISDLNLPDGVESVALSQGEEHDLSVVTVNKGHDTATTDEEKDEGEAEESGAE